MKLKQRLCKHKNLITEELLNQFHGEWSVVEKIIKCPKCGKVKYFYAYGNEHIKDWRRV